MGMLHHPRLGDLRWQDEGWWEGTWSLADDASLEFSVAGDTRGPTEALVTSLEATLGRWHEVNRRLQEFLSRTGERDAKLLEPNAVVYLWEEEPEFFAVELSLEGDEGAIWRVEFERGEPKFLTRDD